MHGAFFPKELDAHKVTFTMTAMPDTHLDTPFLVYTVQVIHSDNTLSKSYLESMCDVTAYQFAFRCAASDMRECSSIRFGAKSWETGLNSVFEPIIMRGKRISLATARALNLIPQVPVGRMKYINNIAELKFNLGKFYLEGVEEAQSVDDFGLSLQVTKKEIRQASTEVMLDSSPRPKIKKAKTLFLEL
jgi:hypothetical protein